MFRFETPQKIFKIGKVRIGGQPGELPTVQIGTIFYLKQKIVKDPKRGIFDKEKAEELIRKQDELSDVTGNPCMLDVVGISPEAMITFIDFVAEVTDAPILIDAMSSDVRIKALKHIAEVGLAERVVYNSIMPAPFFKEEEIDMIKESKVKAALLLAYNVKDRSVRGCLSILRGTTEQKGLLEVAEEVGIEKPLVDVTLYTYVPSIGIGARACYVIKDELGIPAGGAPSNATTVYKRAKQWGPDIYKVCDASAQVISLAFGADYLMYGPIELASYIFPACATVDAMVASAAMEGFGTRTLTEEHPLNKLFPEFVKKLEKVEF